MHGYQAEGAAPLVHGAPVEHPETVASAIRIGNPARWEDAMNAFTASRGEVRAVSDEEILDAYSLLGAREGVFCEPASAASVAGLLKYGAEGRVVCVLTGPRAEGPADGDEPRRARGALRAGHRERRAGGARVKRRRRRARAGVVGEPRARATTCWPRRCRSTSSSRWRRRGEFVVALATSPGVPADRSNLCVRAFERAAPGRRR